MTLLQQPSINGLAPVDDARRLTLLPDQLAARNRLVELWRGGAKSVMICAPTGSGKTVLATELMRSVAEAGKRAVFVADLTELVGQARRTFQRYGLEVGVTQAASYGNHMQLIVASAQTLAREGRRPMHEPDLIVIDEAHVKHKKVLQWAASTKARLVGLSATPLAHGLADHYQAVVNVTTTNELLAAERLVPMRVFAPETQIDHDGVRRNRVGQYDKAELARRTTKVRGNVVAQWVEHKNEVFGPGVRVPTAVFTNTIEDGRAYADEFQRAGYDFRQTTYRTSDRLVRGDVLAAFERREIDGVISCQALAKGWDSSAVLCIIDLQSNGSSVMPVIQKYGRGMRIHADIDADGVVRHQRFSAELERKEQFLLLDHVGNVEGWADQIVDLYENGVGDLRAAKKQYGGQRDDSKRDRGDVTCPACGFLLPAAVRACPSCGRERRRRPATREATDSTRLVERKLEQFISRQEREAEQWRGQIRAKYEDRPNLVWYAVCAFAEKRAETTEAKWARDEKGRRWFAAKQFETLMGVRPARGARYMPDRLSCPNDIDQAIRAQLRSFAIKRKQREDATE